MKVKVRMYAVLKDFFEPIQELPLKAGASVNELSAQLLELKPEARFVLNCCRYAVNEHMIEREYTLSDNDIVDILPPSSGG